MAALGHSRDGKKGTLQVNYGLVTNAEGCPVGVSVHPGNTSDPATLLPQVHRIQEVFGIERLVLVGDRGMVSEKQIDRFRDDERIDWITALRSSAIRKLRDDGLVQMGLFDERNLFELTHPAFPNERLVACRNVELAKARRAKRDSLLEATRKELAKVQRMVERGRLRGQAAIGVRAGRVVNKYKVAKHFHLKIEDRKFSFHTKAKDVVAEAALDGVYVIRTSLPTDRLGASDVVRSYKLLSNVERAFRSFKTTALLVRPIHHRLEERVRAHIFLCLLAFYVQWHLMEAWRELLFSDEDQKAKKRRDPVAPAKRSRAALKKAATHRLDDGSQVHSFRTLLRELSAIVRNQCRRKGSTAIFATAKASKR